MEADIDKRYGSASSAASADKSASRLMPPGKLRLSERLLGIPVLVELLLGAGVFASWRAARCRARTCAPENSHARSATARSGSYPITGSLAVDSGWRSRPRSCGRSAQFPRSEYRNSPRTFGLQCQQSGRLQWAFACIFKRVATIVPRNPESNQRPNLLLLCMFFTWCPWPVSNRAGLKWGVALASHASRFLREEAFAVERDAPDAIRTCDLLSEGRTPLRRLPETAI